MGSQWRKTSLGFWVATCMMAATGAQADIAPFESGWSLQGSNSVLSFQSIKETVITEISTFEEFTGEIDETGKVTITVKLDSIDTKVDLRNVRMRFLLFETFNYPDATISMEVPPDLVADLAEIRRKRIELPYELTIVGLTKSFTAEMVVTLIDANTVSVAPVFPISIGTDLFNLGEGVLKLEETAGFDIIPSATVNFNFVFGRNTPVQDIGIAQLASVETDGDGEPVALTAEACLNRFTSLSETNRVEFESASFAISGSSLGVLNTLAQVIKECPGMNIEVGGHTDATGPSDYNLGLSEVRARTVASYLVELGADPNSLSSRGYGEERPIASNETDRGRARNRRIEFVVQSSS